MDERKKKPLKLHDKGDSRALSLKCCSTINLDSISGLYLSDISDLNHCCVISIVAIFDSQNEFYYLHHTRRMLFFKYCYYLIIIREKYKKNF